jgi:hypothetical protein
MNHTYQKYMKGNKIIKVVLLVLSLAVVVGGGVVPYIYMAPHRDVQNVSTEYVLTSTQLVSEYLADPAAANAKYLKSDGESAVVEIKGIVNSISKDYNDNTVLVLKNEGDKAGVRCVFTTATNQHAASLKIGEILLVKGVIRAGASYDSDLEMYEDVLMEKCDVIQK